MILKEEDYLEHYGILRRSGRYPWGSGKTQSQRNRMFLDCIEDLRKQGFTDTQICEAYSTDANPFTTTMLRAAKSIAVNEQRQQKINQALRLQDKGLSNVAIGKVMGVNESTVRSLLAPGAKDKADILQSTADMLEKQVKQKKWVDIGAQVERDLPLDLNPAARIGISATKFNTAVAILREKGYEVHKVKLEQLGTGKFTEVKVLALPGTTQKEAWLNRTKIQPINDHSENGGRDYLEGWQEPISISSKRLQVRYKEEGGGHEDGVIYVRPGKDDISLGKSNYAQVRVAIDGTHYIKGMAIYKDDLPKGVDLVFNTSKSNTGNKLDALKEMKKDESGNIDPDLPFGSTVRQLKGADKKVYSAMNIVNEEGKWDTWSRSLPSQMLAKQDQKLAKQQLDMTYERRLREFDQIKDLTNPTVKKKFLETFANETDSAAVHLAAAAMPGQQTKAILPVTSMKEDQVYAPTLKNGTRVALVRFPHGGTFEIPQLTVNNRNPEAKKLLGNAADAIGIHHKVAERLSGADFDGDNVLLIPNNRGDIKSTPPLEGLKNFDPRASYKAYDGMKTIDGGTYHASTGTVDYGKDKFGNPRKPNKYMQHQMGDVSNLITDMTLKGANTEDLARAVKHSMVIIDSEKHVLDYRSSARDNGIRDLKARYQGDSRAGASTLISRAGAKVKIEKRKARLASEGGPIDPKTGKKVFVPTGEFFIDRRTGEKVFKKETVKRLAITEDAHKLVSTPTGTPMEHLYADHSNRLKALANQARKEYLVTGSTKAQPSAKKVYADEVASLESKLNVALKNAPLERQAVVISNAMVEQKKQANPGLDGDELRKVRNQALAEARVRTGSHKTRIDLTQSEWDAIQAGAISTNKLEQILDNAKLDSVRKLATPRKQVLMTSNMKSRAQAMLSLGYTQAEVAEQLGVSLTTLKTGLE